MYYMLSVVPAIAADNAKFGQTGPMVGSFIGYGAGLLAAHVGQKGAKFGL